jgi:hypothetical protein
MRSCFGFSGVDGDTGWGNLLLLLNSSGEFSMGLAEFGRNVPPVCQVYMLQLVK